MRYTLDYDNKYAAYTGAHRDRFAYKLLVDGQSRQIFKLNTQSGKLVAPPDEVYRWDAIYSSVKDISFYNSLDNESKAVYTAHFPKKLPYGEKFWIETQCGSNILEVEIVVNGEKLTYKL